MQWIVAISDALAIASGMDDRYRGSVRVGHYGFRFRAGLGRLMALGSAVADRYFES